uniref:Uncharacterized protein n=1 Tax=Oryza sativa subsp. japonica TaxID=39947 RepID=Q69UK5_ORYSJ|nr:hypothetical protein [Oryza sativa Japonica Group]
MMLQPAPTWPWKGTGVMMEDTRRCPDGIRGFVVRDHEASGVLAGSGRIDFVHTMASRILLLRLIVLLWWVP